MTTLRQLVVRMAFRACRWWPWNSGSRMFSDESPENPNPAHVSKENFAQQKPYPCDPRHPCDSCFKTFRVQLRVPVNNTAFPKTPTALSQKGSSFYKSAPRRHIPKTFGSQR